MANLCLTLEIVYPHDFCHAQLMTFRAENLGLVFLKLS